MKAATLTYFACAVSLYSFTIGQSNAAILIDDLTPRFGFVREFGEANVAYVAQTFFAPAAPLGRLTIELRPQQPLSPPTFRVLITEIEPGFDFHPTTVLFESDPRTLRPIPGPQLVSTALGQTQLIAGNQYAYVLDAFADRNGMTSLADIGTNTNYFGGMFHYLNVSYPSNDDESRADHFASDWQAFPPLDFTFRLESVPEPNSFALFSVVSATVLGRRRRRHVRPMPSRWDS